MEEQVRFELTHAFTRLAAFKAAPYNHLGTVPFTSANHEITGLLEELSIPYCLASYPRPFRVVLFIPG